MNPSYSACGFVLHLPEFTFYEDCVIVDYKFVYRNKTEQIVFFNATIDVNGDVIENNPQPVKFDINKKYTKTNISFNKRGHRHNFSLDMIFLSDKGEKISVLFSYDDAQLTVLKDVSRTIMTMEEERIYHQICSSTERDTESYAKKTTIDSMSDNVESVGVEQAKQLPSLDKYLDALKTEKNFLKNAGGHKYKVTNGKLISAVKGIYTYVFDLDAELHLADDAPIKISTGMYNASGNVLMCEDFQMIVELGLHIGDRISSAIVSVEPWKLLEVLDEKLRKNIGTNCGKVAFELIKKGPGLATIETISSIPKGYDKVLEKAMNEPICVVWGPPGTGKTHTMSKIAINYMKQGKSVLIVSHSNVSVDGVVKKIKELLDENHEQYLYENGKILRYGYVRDEELNKDEFVSSFYHTVHKNPDLNKRIDELQNEYDKEKHIHGIGTQKIINIRKEISSIRTKIRTQEVRYVESAAVVATTISKVVIDSLFENKKYDVVMFDEVSMAYVLQVAFAATYANEHFICVGDFMQLAPIAQSDVKDILCEDIFTYLGITRNGEPYYHPWLVMLDEQRRMHPAISAFVSKNIYENMLKDHESTSYSRDEIVEAELFKNMPASIIDLFGCYCAADKDDNNSRFNLLSAFISFAMAIKTEPNVETVSIITPYAAQTRLIRAMVLDYRVNRDTNIRCATVHQFQGSESDVVIFDAVESYPKKKPGFLLGKDFNSILRLVNVAVSRAKGKFITIANRRFWVENYGVKNQFANSNHTYYKLLEHLGTKGNVVQHMDNRSLEKLVNDLSINKGPEFYLDENLYIEQLKKDILKARSKIVISLPSGKIKDENNDIVNLLDSAKNKGIVVMCKSNRYADLPDSWKKYAYGTDNAVFPIIMIDDEITWYGAPFAPWEFVLDKGKMGFKTVCPIACRVGGEHTAEIIKSITDLEYIETDGSKQLLTMKDTVNLNVMGDDKPRLSSYIKKIKKCPVCKIPLELIRGKSGKVILWCTNCKKPHLLSPDDVNHYICVEHIRCPEDNSFIAAGLGKMGVYIKCDRGHFLKPEEI